jgi:transcriptional regulator with XRE-family HTH domain
MRRTNSDAEKLTKEKSGAPAANGHAGRVLQRLRHEHNWTLAEVSRRTGVSIATLSKIENGRSAPAYGVLTRLADGLGIDFVELIGSPKRPFAGASRAVTRAGQGTPFRNAMGSYEALASELAAKSLQPLVIDIPVRRRGAERVRSSHRGEEFVYVLDGDVTFIMDPYAPITLTAGDSVYFDCAASHGFSAIGRPARILSVCLGRGGDHDGAGEA